MIVLLKQVFNSTEDKAWFALIEAYKGVNYMK